MSGQLVIQTTYFGYMVIRICCVVGICRRGMLYIVGCPIASQQLRNRYWPISNEERKYNKIAFMSYSLRSKIEVVMGAFVGLDHPDRSADPPQQTLFINQPLQYFSLTKPTSFSQVSDQRTEPKVPHTRAPPAGPGKASGRAWPGFAT